MEGEKGQERIAKGNRGGEYNIYNICMYGNVIMKPLTFYK
jgi:hypothetical protein